MDFDCPRTRSRSGTAPASCSTACHRTDVVRQVVDAGTGRSDELWTAMVEQGWLGVALPEERGGLGLGTVELAVLLEEVGRHAAPAPFAPTVLAIDALDAAGDADAVERLVGRRRQRGASRGAPVPTR